MDFLAYPDEFIGKLLKANNITKLFAKYGPLENKGSYYLAKCPFHQGETAEVILSVKDNTYKCFSCGETGNPISFIMKMRNCSFDEAVGFLAKRAKMEVPALTEISEDNTVKEKMFSAYSDAALFYYRYCKAGPEKAGREYLSDTRSLTPETIARFGLGYSPKNGGMLYKHLQSLGYSERLLHAAGLIGFTKGGRIYDKFWSRVMFPIFDLDNRVIGFGGRTLLPSKTEKTPKYLNSQETLLFDKKKNLYGMNIAQHSKKKYFICCEGFMDVISLHQAGFNTAVASLGTALTEEQTKLLAKYTKNVYLAYDSDGPGKKAAISAADLFAKQGINCKVINMLPYKDPDEFIKNEGKAAFEKRIKAAESGEHFKVRQLREISDPTQFYDAVAGLLLDKEENNEKITT